MTRNHILSCFFFLAALLIARHGFAQSHVATVTKFTNSSTATISQGFAGSSTTGNLIVVHLSWDNQTRSISTVTDTKGNTYARINGPTNWHTNYRSELWYAYNITGGGAPITVTATLSGVSTSYFQIYISEYSGISTTTPLDQHSVNIGNTAAVSSGSKTTLVANELVYGVSIGAAGLLTVGATFTARSTANQNIVEDKIAATVGSYNASFSSAGGDWVAEMATFRPLIVLPIELESFDASVINGNAVKLDWITAMEENNAYFELQRSHDGSDWSTVANIKGAGNSSTAIHYSSTDNSPYPGQSYYRLVQYDFDGHTQSSKVLAVNIVQPEERIKVYPNPVVSYITIEGNYADLQGVCVTNSMGELVCRNTRAVNENDLTLTLDLSTLPQGVYFLKTRHKCVPFNKK